MVANVDNSSGMWKAINVSLKSGTSQHLPASSNACNFQWPWSLWCFPSLTPPEVFLCLIRNEAELSCHLLLLNVYGWLSLSCAQNNIRSESSTRKFNHLWKEEWKKKKKAKPLGSSDSALENTQRGFGWVYFWKSAPAQRDEQPGGFFRGQALREPCSAVSTF